MLPPCALCLSPWLPSPQCHPPRCCSLGGGSIREGELLDPLGCPWWSHVHPCLGGVDPACSAMVPWCTGVVHCLPFLFCRGRCHIGCLIEGPFHFCCSWSSRRSCTRQRSRCCGRCPRGSWGRECLECLRLGILVCCCGPGSWWRGVPLARRCLFSGGAPLHFSLMIGLGLVLLVVLLSSCRTRPAAVIALVLGRDVVDARGVSPCAAFCLACLRCCRRPWPSWWLPSSWLWSPSWSWWLPLAASWRPGSPWSCLSGLPDCRFPLLLAAIGVPVPVGSRGYLFWFLS